MEQTKRFATIVDLLKELQDSSSIFEQDKLIKKLEKEIVNLPGVMRADLYSELEFAREYKMEGL